ncbi:restriction endonuclease subunit S [Cobetia amphilecti]|uniref:restriction endonuclease subunit S n=1 Tax=Cobetia amphilecti TaxID=1055104 RepID=UPI0033749003
MQLGDLASIQAGYPFRGKIADVPEGEALVVQMRDIADDGIDWASCTRTALTGKRAPNWLKPGDLLVAARGSHYYAIEVDSQAEEHCVAAPHFYVVKAQLERILPRYLCWLINQRPCQRFLEQNAEGSLTKSIRRRVLESLPITVPPLKRQHQWVGLIDTLSQERRLLHEQLAANSALQSALAADLLGHQDERNP